MHNLNKCDYFCCIDTKMYIHVSSYTKRKVHNFDNPQEPRLHQVIVRLLDVLLLFIFVS